MSANLLEQLRESIRSYVMQLFADLYTPALAYHNLEHTLQVVTRAETIGRHYNLNEEEMFVLFSAAWFHDTGQLRGAQAGHEDRSVDIIKDFFRQHPVPINIQDAIEQCILATKMPQHPHGLLQEILCDADTYHFGTADLWLTDEQMRQETILRGGSDDNWAEGTRWLLSHHTYHTDYCRLKLNAGKAKNLAALARESGQLSGN